MRLHLNHFAAAALVTCLAAPTAGSAAPAAKQIDVNGVTLDYVDEGQGEPVVFVHPAAADLRTWEPMRQAISDEHRFIAPTLRYFGTGDWPDQGEAFSTATHADDVAAFIEALDAGPVHLVSWSSGANIAMAAALENPDLVRSIVLFEPGFSSLVKEGEAGDAAREAAGRMYGPVTAAVQEGDAEKATKLLLEGAFELPPGGWDSQPEALRRIQLDNARTTPLLWSAPPWNLTCDMLKALDKPTLVVHGAESNAFWTHIARTVGECLPRAEVAVLPKARHDAPVRDPAGLAAMIEDFVAKH